MTTSLITSLHTETDISFAKTPAGELFMVNGLSRGKKWNGSVDSTPVFIGLDAPTAAPTVTTPTTGGAEAGDYLVAYRFGDADGNYSNLSPTATVTAVAADKFSWDTVGVATGTDSSARVTKRQLFRSLVGSFEVLYLVTEIADNSTTSYTTDTLTDDDLGDNEELPILNDDDTLSANRFSVPPTTKKVALWHQDRMFYLADAYYSTGTITVTGASTALTGSGTTFTNAFVGRYVYPLGSVKGYRISAYVSATALTLATAYGGSTLTGVAYEIRPAPGDINTIFYSEADEPESVPQSQNKFVLQQNTNDDDVITGGYSIGQTLYVTQRRHTYGFSYTRQPHLDGSASLLYRRGMFNQNCYDIGDDTVFVMDQYGPYAVTGGGRKDVGRPIADYFTSGGVDFAYERRFFVRCNSRTNVARFYVALTGDGGVKSCFAYNYELDRWWIETYPWIVGCAVNLRQNNQYDYYVGKASDRFAVESYTAAADGSATAVSGTVAGVSSNTLTASGASFATSAVIGYPITFTSGTAKHSRCVVSAYTSTTVVDVDSMPSGVAAGDTFVLGGIPCSMKTGMMTYPQNNQNAQERDVVVVFQPTTTSGNYLDIRHYLNHKTSPETFPHDLNEKEDRVGFTAGSADGIATLYKNRNELYETVGVARKTFSGRSADNTNADRFLSIELRTVTNGEIVEVSDLIVNGAK